MSAQLSCDPILKITLTSDEVFDEVAPGYVIQSFKLTKGLLKPNKFEFDIRREELTLESTDIDFELKDKLLAAMVEVNLKARYYDVNEDMWKEHDIEDFFYGYIQNIKVFRTNGKPLTFRCTAYSPDVRLRRYPTCRTFWEHTLKDAVSELARFYTVEKMTKYNPDEGTYKNYSDDGLAVAIETNTPDDFVMPYTVQYNENGYDFLCRLARRYGEFLYYENREFVFGKMKELPEIELYNGTSLEEYEYDMNMNDHDGIVLCEHDFYTSTSFGTPMEKKNYDADQPGDYTSVVKQDDYQNRMANAAYKTASDFYVDTENSICELGATPHLETSYEMEREAYRQGWHGYQRALLDRYVMSDSLICTGKAARMDLKLGSILKLKDETNTGENEEWREHQPLKVIELTYEWERDKNLDVENTFKAIPQDAVVPPYLHRDEDGFLHYGDFDAYPKSGPQYGMVVDNVDPLRMGRVRVSMLWQVCYGSLVEDDYDRFKDSSRWTPWIWVVSSNQGMDRGPLALPEIGDQVLVGYESNNVERPYVIGSRFGKSEIPGEWKDYEKNRVKGFRSRSGHTIEIIDTDDIDGTPGGKVRIYDSKTYNYEILFDADKSLIRLKSKGNIELDADDNIILHAGKDLTINVDHNMVTNVENEQETHVKKNKFTEVTEGPIITYAKESQTHRTEAGIYLYAQVTSDNVDDVLSKLELSDKHATMVLYDGHGSDNRSVLGMDTTQIQVATNWPNSKILVASRQGGDVEIMSDQKNVNIGAGMNVDVKANQSASIDGKAQTSVTGGMVKIN